MPTPIARFPFTHPGLTPDPTQHLQGKGLDNNSDGLIDSSLLPAGASPTALFTLVTGQTALGTVNGSTVMSVDDAGIVRIPTDATGALRIGAGDDLRQWHDGTHSWYRNYTGNLYIGTSGATLLSFQTSSLTRAYFDANGAFILGNAAIQSGAKLDIQTTGQAHALTVEDSTGIVRVAFDNAGALRIGASDALRFGFSGGHSFGYSHSGNLYLGTAGGNSSNIWFQTAGVSRGRWDHAGAAFVVGTAALQSGAKLDIQTTGQAHAGYWADADGTLHLPWDAASSGAPNIAIGAGDDLRLYHDGTDSYVYNNNGGLQVFQSANAEMRFRCNSASGGDITFYTRGANLRCSITGNGLNLNPVASAPGTPVNGDIWITTGGALQFRANGTTYTVTAT